MHWRFTLKEIKGDRQRDERIDIFSSPFGSLWEEENYFKAAALMKEKGVMADVFFQRWNQQYEWLKGMGGGEGWGGGFEKRTFVWENYFFCWGIRVPFDSSEQNSDSPVRRCDWFNTQRWIISGVCIEEDSRCHQIVRSFAVSSLGILLDWAPAKSLSENAIWCHILPQPSWQA